MGLLSGKLVPWNCVSDFTGAHLNFNSFPQYCSMDTSTAPPQVVPERQKRGYQNAIPFVDPAKLLAPCLPTKKVSDQPDLTHLFQSAGLNRVISVLLNMSEAVASIGLLDTDQKRSRLSDSISPVCRWLLLISLGCSNPPQFNS